ncbi:MAG TPA: nucleotidyl transferase AbiEii/AbiGii toxin family protein [Pyrinomonadaceae bacterium]|nr:nucleotidyl transferase AbiEii/AbiGii toxin family protein [Pyrinomonadaceae bacterium]
MFDLFNEFRSLVAAFHRNQIDYALCGGLAMAIYGRARATVDIDILLLSDSLDAAKNIARELGYNIRGLDMSFAKGAIEIRRLSKIDSESGQVLSLDFLLVTPQIQEVWDRRVKAEWQDGTISVVSREGLIALKSLRNSVQDEADIAVLEGKSEDGSS